MEINELVKQIQKKEESPTAAIKRVLNKFILEHPEEVIKEETMDDLKRKITMLETKLIEKKFGESVDSGVRVKIGEVQPVKSVPEVQTVPVLKDETSMDVMSGIVDAKPRDHENAVHRPQPPIETGTLLTNEDEILAQLNNQAWAKSSNPLRRKIINYIEDEKKKKMVKEN